MKIGRHTYVYWWRNPRHRANWRYGISVKWRADLGMGWRCSWIDIGPLEIRTVHRP